MSQADVIRYLGRGRFDLSRKQGWLKPRTIIRGARGRAMENYAFSDVREAERKFLEP